MQVAYTWSTTFSTNQKQADLFLSQVCSLLDGRPRTGPLEVLEVGCGDGGKLARLAELWPNMNCTGIDIAEPNIRLAESLREQVPARDRLNFILGDYRKAALPRFDVILSDSTLHLIPGTNDEIFGKLAGELKSGGLLIFTIPHWCVYNALLWSARRVLRAVRSPATDWVVLSLASGLHGRGHSREFLRERMHYMYILPYRYGSRQFAQALFQQHRLALQVEARCPHRSLGQPKHSLYCFQMA